MTRRWPLPCLATILALLLTLSPNAGGAVDDQTIDRLTDEVRRVVAETGRGPDEGVLIALRELRDERLRPLFAGMALRDDPKSKIHGIFGLADLTPERKVNIGQIAGISNENLRAMILGAAIGGDYLTTRHMHQVLNWPEIEPTLELAVTSKLMQAGEEVSVERLRQVASSCPEEKIASRIFALLLIAQLEGDSKATEARARLDEVDAPSRGPLVAFALAQVLAEKLFALRDFVVEEHRWAQSRPTLRLQSIATLLGVEPSMGLEEWRAAYDSEAELAMRIRLGLVLLQASPYVGPDAFDPLIGDDIALLDHMGRAGRAVVAQENEAPALLTLLADQHALSTAWVFQTIESMDEDRRARVLEGILRDATGTRSDPGAGVPAYLYEVARLLEAARPGATGPFLSAASAADDAALCEVLLAALNGTRPHVAWTVGDAPAWPDRTTRVLAIIAEARAGNALDQEALELLISAGTGAESLPPSFRIQAAWLALCQVGRDREALTKILAPSRE